MQSNSRLFYFVASVVLRRHIKEATINLTSSRNKGVGMLIDVLRCPLSRQHGEEIFQYTCTSEIAVTIAFV